MAHAKDDARLCDGGLHLNTILDAGGHGLLAKNVVALFCEGFNNFCVHFVLHGHNNSVRKALADSLQGFSRSRMKVSPGSEDKCIVD
jgi:hypothetical protein